MERLASELRRLIEETVETLRDEITAGMLTDMQDYKKLTGQIIGLRTSLALIEEAMSNISKR